MMNSQKYSTELRHQASQSYVKVPAVELLRQHLCQHPVGHLIDVTVRALADAIQRSASRISGALKRLQIDGWITILPTPIGTLVEVRRSIGSDQPPDRTISRPLDTESPSIALQCHETQAPFDPGADRKDIASPCDQGADRVDVYGTSCIHVYHQHQEAHAPKKQQSEPERPPEVFPGAWRNIQAARPGYSEQDWNRDLAAFTTRRDIPPAARVPKLVKALSNPDGAIFSQAEIDAQTPVISNAPVVSERPPRSRRKAEIKETCYGNRPEASDDELEVREQRLSRLCADATEDEQLVLLIAFDEGLDDAAALARLEAVRGAYE